MLEHRKPCGTPSESLGKPPFRSGRRTAGGRRKTLTMPRIAGGFPPTRPMARRIACPISRGHYQGPLVLGVARNGPAALERASTYFHRRVTHLTALRVLQARSVVRRDGGASQGPRDDSVRARKAARRVVFHGHRRASPPLDDVQTSPARRFHPGGREKTIICITLL